MEADKGGEKSLSVCVCGWEGVGGVKLPRLFSTFCIMTRTWFHTQLCDDKYCGQPIRFRLYVWRGKGIGEVSPK